MPCARLAGVAWFAIWSVAPEPCAKRSGALRERHIARHRIARDRLTRRRREDGRHAPLDAARRGSSPPKLPPKLPPSCRVWQRRLPAAGALWRGSRGEALVARLCGGGSVEHARLVGGDHVLDVDEGILAAILLEALQRLLDEVAEGLRTRVGE